MITNIVCGREGWKPALGIHPQSAPFDRVARRGGCRLDEVLSNGVVWRVGLTAVATLHIHKRHRFIPAAVASSSP